MTTRFRTRMLVTVAALAACAHAPTDLGVQELGEGIPFRIFPELPTWTTDPSWNGGWIPPTPEAAPCVAVTAPDADWRPLRARTSSRWLTAVTVRVPGRFVVSEVNDLPPGSEDRGGILVGSWYDSTAHLPHAGPTAAQLSVWITPDSGYATVGADTAARQVALAECTSASPAAGTHLITFTLNGPMGVDHYVGAVWPIAGGRYVQALGSANRPEDAVLLRRAITSMAVEGRTR